MSRIMTGESAISFIDRGGGGAVTLGTIMFIANASTDCLAGQCRKDLRQEWAEIPVFLRNGGQAP
jgi:hypothetical protein